MLHIRHVLFATDFSETCAAAFSMAATLAHDYGARLTVVHVATPPPVMVSGEMMLPVGAATDPAFYQNLWNQLRNIRTGYKDVVVDHKLIEGDPAREILGLADSEEVDLIVLGTHGRTGLSRLLMGSVAEQVSRKAQVPVLLVKDPKRIGRFTAPVQVKNSLVEEAVGVAK
jgi:nucleotide-binding universal stress UspA family protein